MKKFLFIILALIVSASCERIIYEFAPNRGGADFTKYVAVGNSLTAGFTDGALYLSGQQFSISNILAGQFRLVGGGEFRQPLIATENGVGFTPIPGGLYYFTKRILKVLPVYDCTGQQTGTTLKPDFAVVNPDQAQLQQELFAPPTVAGPYNNMGVPMIRVKELFIPGYGHPQFGNPYFARFATSTTTTVIQDAIAQEPTFFSLWIGNNDVLISAYAGTDALITPVDTFTLYFNMAVNALVNSPKSPNGILANIPDITTIPFFNTISKKLPYNSVVLDTAQAAGLNQRYAMYGHPEITWQPGQNPFVITTTTGQWVRMGAEDLFLLTLPTDSVQCRGMGVENPTTLTPYPIPGKYVLQKSEIDNLKAAIAAYNQKISDAADLYGLALVNMNQLMVPYTFPSGMVFDGVTISTTFVTGGMFSTDGIHLCPRGNAVAVNYFIQAINGQYGSKIPEVDITSYSGLVFP